MIDGTALQMAMAYGWHAAGKWTDERGTNLLDGGAPFYDTYKCADGKYVAIGALEPKFYALLLELTGIQGRAPESAGAQMDRARWPELKKDLETLFLTRTRDEWCAIMEGTDACFAPVLDMEEAPGHPHNVMRDTFVEVDGVKQPAPAPRFSRTAVEIQASSSVVGADTEDVLKDFGFRPDEIARLRDSGAI
jgi:alpha-methylacyl-CoA racemase